MESPGSPSLTPRQQQVKDAIVAGLSDEQAAELLEISIHTLRHHLQDVFKRLGVNRRVALLRTVQRTAGDADRLQGQAAVEPSAARARPSTGHVPGAGEPPRSPAHRTWAVDVDPAVYAYLQWLAQCHRSSPARVLRAIVREHAAREARRSGR